jgi:hypothetical protein
MSGSRVGSSKTGSKSDGDATTTGTVTSRDGTRIAFERSGTGPPVILVDGALCCRGIGPSRGLAAALAGHVTAYAYDRRGRGESGDTAPYAPEREVEDLAALVAAAGGNAVLVGVSSGGELALRAAEAGVGVRALALYEPPLAAGDAAPPTAPEYPAELAAALAAGDRAKAVTLFLTKAVGLPRVVPAVMRLLPMWRRLTAVAPTLPYDDAIVAPYRTGGPVARRVDVPVLVLAGGRSPQWLRDAARGLAGVLPAGRYRELPGETHNVRARATAPALLDFLAEVPGSPRP